MFDALAAEALKMRRHRGTWLMVWIYPIAILLIAVASLIYYSVTSPGAPPPPETAASWIADSALFWRAPGSPPGRLLLAGFAALVFAGEYSWNTWKLIIPARARWQLIVAKWAVAAGFTVLALLATSAIVLATSSLRGMQGAVIPDGVTAAAVLQAHARMAAYALLPIGYGVALAGLFAVLTRSILATVVLSIVVLILEGMLQLLALFFYARAPGLTQFLVEVLPFYHLGNLASWATARQGQPLLLGPGTTIDLSWATSLWAMLAWIAVAGAVTMVHFQRQDLN